MNNEQIRQHGEKYPRKFTANEGKTVYIRYVRYCVIHGEIDCFLFPNFELEHGDCPYTPQAGAAAQMPLVMRKAA